MSTETIVGLRGPLAGASQPARAAESGWVLPPDTTRCKFLGLRYIALDQIVEKDAGNRRFTLREMLHTLWDIFFPDQERATYRALEGEDMTPIVAYQSGDRYIVAEGATRVAAARYIGSAYVLAEVWALP